MARYAMMTTMTADLREDLDEGQAAEYLRFTLEGRLRGEGDGYRPVGEPEVTWAQWTAEDEALHIAQLREIEGHDDDMAPPGYREGDWMVRVISETEPLPRPAG
jgi:hypothetical protein